MPTKKRAGNSSDDLRPEYNLATLRGGVRGKYYQRARAGTNLVLIEPDIATVFPDGEAVNDALRDLISVAKSHAGERRVRKASDLRGLRRRAKKPRAARG